jgi:hypothetical protein
MEIVAAYFKVLAQHLPVGTVENHKDTSIMRAGLQAEI